MNQTSQLSTVKFNLPKLYRFQLYMGDRHGNGKIEKTKIVGMSYLQEGQGTYTIRLWTFLNTNFYLLMSKDDSSKYLIMSRESNKNLNSKTKYFWNVIGHGKAMASQNCIELNFDLLHQPVYMSIFPESNTAPSVVLSKGEMDLPLAA